MVNFKGIKIYHETFYQPPLKIEHPNNPCMPVSFLDFSAKEIKNVFQRIETPKLSDECKEYLTFIYSALHDCSSQFFNKKNMYPTLFKVNYFVISERKIIKKTKLALHFISKKEALLFHRGDLGYQGSRKRCFPVFQLSNLERIVGLEIFPLKNISLKKVQNENRYLLNQLQLKCVPEVKRIELYPASNHRFSPLSVVYEKEYISSLANLKRKLIKFSSIRAKDQPFALTLQNRMQFANQVLEILLELENNKIVNRNITIEHLLVDNFKLSRDENGNEEIDFKETKIVLCDWSLACPQLAQCSAEGNMQYLDFNIFNSLFQVDAQKSLVKNIGSIAPYQALNGHDSWAVGMVIWALLFNDYHPITDYCQEDETELQELITRFKEYNQLLLTLSNPLAKFFQEIFKLDVKERKQANELIALFSPIIQLSQKEIEDQIFQISMKFYSEEWNET